MLRSKSPVGVFTSGALLLALAFHPTTYAEFYLTRNQNPFTLFQGQPLPLSASRLSEGWHLQQSLDISNSLNSQSDNSQNLLVDFESYYLNTRLTRALNKNWSLTLDIPMLHRGTGIFDSAIDSWHKALGLPRASRPNVANNQFAIRYSQNSIPQVQILQSSTELGDISANIGYHLKQSPGLQIVLWIGAELPSGNATQLAGNAHTDVSLTLAATLMPFPRWQIDMNLGVVAPGGNLIASNPTADNVWYAYLAADWQLIDWLQLRVQLESHQSYFVNSTLGLMDKANVIVFGGTININKCNLLDIGVSEDIDVGASPDISVLFSWRYRGVSC